MVTSTRKHVLAIGCLVMGLVLSGALQAQDLDIDIVNGTKSATPIAVVPFALENAGTPPETKVSRVVDTDLKRSGKFNTLDSRDIVAHPHRGQEIEFSPWQLLKQDYLVVGHLSDGDNGGFDVTYELWDVNSKKKLLEHTYSGAADELRGVGHRIADAIYQKVTGVPGAFYTRIAYITARGTGSDTDYSLIVADSDGYNPQVVVRSQAALVSPAWSPDGSKLAYVSFESGNSAVYIQDLETGARHTVAANKGINGAPAFSPDGSKLAVSLSKVGNSEIFIIDLDSGTSRRLTHNYAIDTEPEWTADGKHLVFTSDRAGRPQLYRIAASGGSPQRLTFEGSYNSNASVDHENGKLAMVRGKGNVYRIVMKDHITDGREHFVSPGNFDEAPSFAPNGDMLLYAATQGSRGVLYAVSADGNVRQRLVLSHGDVRSPAWGPFRQHSE